MLNSVNLQGRLTANPELKQTTNGKNVMSFDIAVQRNYKSHDGKDADFISCVAWDKTAEFINRFFTKGKEIIVEGALTTRNYDDRNGNKRTVTEIRVERAQFCGGKNENIDVAPPAANSDFVPPAQNNNDIPDDDNLPF